MRSHYMCERHRQSCPAAATSKCGNIVARGGRAYQKSPIGRRLREHHLASLSAYRNLLNRWCRFLGRRSVAYREAGEMLRRLRGAKVAVERK